MLTPFLVIIGFALLIIILGIFKPQAARIILGIFFLLMALAVNLPLAISNPAVFVEAGRDAFLPFYQWIFTVVIAWNPPLFVFALVLFEIAVGLLVLSRGRWAKLGLLAGAGFCLAITPIGPMALTNPAISIAMLLMLRHDFSQSVLEIASAAFQGFFSEKRKNPA